MRCKDRCCRQRSLHTTQLSASFSLPLCGSGKGDSMVVVALFRAFLELFAAMDVVNVLTLIGG